MRSDAVDNVITGDCREVLEDLPHAHFSCCLTDPPYNYEFIGRNWDEAEIDRRVSRVQESSTLVKNIPYGSGLAGGVRNARWYENNRRNAREYREWCHSWALPLFRVMRPGAYCMVFNSTRTVAHVQIALEDAGFYARDTLVYRRHAGIPKGLNVAKKLCSLGDPDADAWRGWHSCLRNEWEAICLVQKPLLGNYITTLRKTGVGLLRAQPDMDGSFLSNIIDGIKREDDPVSDIHCTVKPLALVRFLLELAVPTNQPHIVIDPFAGTGTTCLAARQLGHHYLGIEISPRYAACALQRLAEEAAPMPQQPRALREHSAMEINGTLF